MHKQKVLLQNGQSVLYQKIVNNPVDERYVVFLHGLMSSSSSTKAEYIKELCRREKLNFFVFDNLGHGESSGDFKSQNITSWLETFKEIYKKFLMEHPIILVGSSTGGWIALLFAMLFPQAISSMLLLAPAPDFTEDVWNDLSRAEQNQMIDQGYLEIGTYEISYNLIQDGKNHLLLTKPEIKIDSPIIIIHGVQDTEIDYKKSLALLNRISSKKAFLYYIKNAFHKLSDVDDLAVIKDSFISLLKFN